MNLEPEECKKRFQLLEKIEKDKNGGKTYYLLSGAKGEKTGYHHKEINEECGKFESKATKIPRGYKRVTQKRNDNYVKDFACKKCKTKKAKKIKGALSWEKWYAKSRKYWLTIKDLESISNGTNIQVLAIHPNVLDGPQTYYKEQVAYRPEVFFKSEKDTLHKKGSLDFTSKIIHADSWGLDVELKKHQWCPLSKEGMVRVDKNDVHWSKLNKNRPIGYQGPLILWSNLKKLPRIYYK
jgi:hypothetical protein